MAKCRNCGAEISEGAEYCAECLSKLNTAKDSESYLDSLLSAVMTDEPERREIVYPKREASSLVSVPEDKNPTTVEAEEPMAAPKSEVPPMEDALGVFFDADAELPDLKSYNIFENMDEYSVDRLLAADLGSWEIEKDDFEEEFEELMQDASGSAEEGNFEEEFEESMPEVPDSEVGDIEDLFGMLEDERGADAPEEIVMATPEVISAADLDAAADTFSGIVEEPEEAPEEEPVAEFGDLADLFSGFEDVEEASAAVAEETAEEEPIAEFGDFADLFGSGDGEQDETPASAASQNDASLSDFADLFGSSDGEFGGLFEFGAEPEVLDDGEDTSDEDVFATMGATMNVPVSQEEDAPVKKEEKKKRPRGLAALYHKLFDNVKMDPSKIKPEPTKEEIEAQKKAKKEEKERAKEEKEALLAEKKEQEKQVKLEKQRVAKEAKAEKKARKLEEAKLMLEEMEKTRINRAGASIVFIFFAMIAVVIIVGTSIFSYSLSIKNAEYEFERDEYTLAYNEIYGLDVKDEDIVLYDRIMTVMYVQKQLNSYYNYYGMNDKPKALDSLLKGLQRYEKYIELAVKLDVDSDLDSVRKKILVEITTTFKLTEQEAMEIIQSDSQAEYSKKVYDAVEGLE